MAREALMVKTMPCHISDGPDLSEDYPEIDMTDEWRQMEVDKSHSEPPIAPLAGRIAAAIYRMSRNNYIDFHEHLMLLQDMQRMLEKIELPPKQAD
jgi:hypothetical protein